MNIINPYRFAAAVAVTLPNYWWDLDDDNTWSNDGELSALTLTESGTVVTTTSTIGSGGSRTVADMDGTSHLVDNTATWDGAQSEVSMACWVKVDNLDSQGAGVMVWRGSGKVMQIQLNTIDATTANVTSAVWDAGGDLVFTSTSSTVLTEGEWTHVAATWDGTTLKVYRNATEVGSNTNAAVGAFTTASGTFQMGKRETSGAYDLDGQVAFAGIWDIALTEDELAELYNNGDGASYAEITWA